EETVERSIEEARRTLETATTVVSSIRLREEDARIIDELVDAGIFRSRSEAVAFFTHKGIEASREWLEKVKEQIERIKELRDEVRRELEKSEKKQ
ncbi:MAG: ribbon-helix-helix protein, CopG family, partial [Desulfurococcaceae archaeon]